MRACLIDLRAVRPRSPPTHASVHSSAYSPRYSPSFLPPGSPARTSSPLGVLPSAVGDYSADGPMAIRSLGGAAMNSATSPARCDPTTGGLALGRALAAGGGATAGGGVSCGSSENFSAKFSATFPREVTRAVSAGSLSRGSAIPNRADARSGPFLGDFAGPPLARRPASATCTAARLRASRRCVRARPSPSNWPAGQGAGMGSSPLLGGGARRI